MSAASKGQRAARTAHHARNRHRAECARKGKRGANRIHRNTFDVDSPEAQIHAPLGDDGSFESSEMMRGALLETVVQVRNTTAKTTRYSQGVITRVGADAMRALLNPKAGFDHFTGTNESANSQIASDGVFSLRHWYRVKPALQRLGLISYVHRSIPTGLSKEQHLQISDLYRFSPDNLLPWVREIFDAVYARIKANALDREKGNPRVRTPLVKRNRPHRRIPALLNPIGWARAQAAEAAAFLRPNASYAQREAEGIAMARQLVAEGWGAVPG